MVIGNPPLSALQELDFIVLSKGNNLRNRTFSLFKKAGIEPRIKLELAQLVTAYSMAEQGFAATFTGDRLVTNTKTPLCFYLLDSPSLKRQFYMLLPDKEYTSCAVRTFIALFRKEIATRIRNG